MVRRKHFPLNLTVQLPNVDEPIHIETNTSLKIKQLKELIKVKSPIEAQLAEVSIDRL